MERIIFVNENGDHLMTVKDLKDYILPRVGDAVIWMRLHLTITSITHNYDSKEIVVDVEVG